jgi:MraZ protein
MFYGQKDLAIDDKSRLVLPSLFRNEFTGGVCYASIGMDNCIELYPEETYQEKAKKFMGLSDFDPKARKVKRTFMSNTFNIQIDSHNRILLPKPLVTKAQINRKVVIVGVGDRLEIWDSDVFEKNEREAEESFSDDALSLNL